MQDKYGFAADYPLHGPWTSTPAHSESAYDANVSGLNTVSGKFEVATSNATAFVDWTTAVTACPSGWRLPTVRELCLIYALKNELTSAHLPSGILAYGWAGTTVNSDTAWSVYFDDGSVRSDPKASPCFVRCVRDL